MAQGKTRDRVGRMLSAMGFLNMRKKFPSQRRVENQSLHLVRLLLNLDYSGSAQNASRQSPPPHLLLTRVEIAAKIAGRISETEG